MGGGADPDHPGPRGLHQKVPQADGVRTAGTGGHRAGAARSQPAKAALEPRLPLPVGNRGNCSEQSAGWDMERDVAAPCGRARLFGLFAVCVFAGVCQAELCACPASQGNIPRETSLGTGYGGGVFEKLSRVFGISFLNLSV